PSGRRAVAPTRRSAAATCTTTAVSGTLVAETSAATSRHHLTARAALWFVARQPARRRRSDSPSAAVPAADERHELLTGLEPVAEVAEHAARHHDRVLLFDAAHPHAEMLRLDDDADALRVDRVHDARRDLGRETLLHLQAAGEHLEEPRELAQPEDAVARDVGDVRLPEERQQVMLAEREEVEILQHDHLGVLFGEERRVQDLVRVLAVALGE